MATPVYLEIGSKRVFARSLDWPGWCRSGKDEDGALLALAEYASRYKPVADAVGGRFAASRPSFEVVERVPGSATTDFGAPGSPAQVDSTRVTKRGADRLARAVQASWDVLERTAAPAPATLRKGPRGGGRDRDAMVQHVLDAEVAYGRKIGVRGGDRAAMLDAIRAAEPPAEKAWPLPFAARRIAWHALDHAWEMEDRSAG